MPPSGPALLWQLCVGGGAGAAGGGGGGALVAPLVGGGGLYLIPLKFFVSIMICVFTIYAYLTGTLLIFLYEFMFRYNLNNDFPC